jgi:hypothetical protein
VIAYDGDMGVHHHMTAAPRQARVPERAQFAALFDDLLKANVIGFPACVLIGSTPPSAFALGTALGRHFRDGVAMPSTLMLSAAVSIVDASRCGIDEPPLTEHDISSIEHERTLNVHYAGWNVDDLSAAVDRAPIGLQDVAVYFTSRFRPPAPEVAAIDMFGCDAGLSATLRPHALVHAEPFAQGSGRYLVGAADSDAVRSFPVRDTGLGCQVHPAYWYLELEGKQAWDLMAPALAICQRHFGDDHFAGWSCS